MSLKRIKLIIILIGFAFFVVLLFYFIQQNSNLPDNERVQDNLVPLSFGLPIHLKIPGINVDSIVEYVGFTSDGAMDVPKDFVSVAWFNLGPRPGENGSAVIAGHYGLKDGKASVFDNLHTLHKDDKLYVEDDKGVIISFVVREIRSYDPEDDALDVFSSNDGKSHLNLITCEGVWDKISKSYPKRLVVFTDKE